MDVGQNWNYGKLYELVESVVVVMVSVVMVVGDLEGELFFRAAMLCPSPSAVSICCISSVQGIHEQTCRGL